MPESCKGEVTTPAMPRIRHLIYERPLAGKTRKPLTLLWRLATRKEKRGLGVRAFRRKASGLSANIIHNRTQFVKFTRFCTSKKFQKSAKNVNKV